MVILDIFLMIKFRDTDEDCSQADCASDMWLHH